MVTNQFISEDERFPNGCALNVFSLIHVEFNVIHKRRD